MFSNIVKLPSFQFPKRKLTVPPSTGRSFMERIFLKVSAHNFKIKIWYNSEIHLMLLVFNVRF
jgi:hypothetical protein